MRHKLEELEHKCREIKYKALEMCVQARTGHVTSAFSCAEIVTVLYYELMNIDRKNPRWDNRDRFVMSKNHASVILYPVFADFGWIEESALNSFLANGSMLGSHSKIEIPGVDFSGGSLGIGLGVACGFAYAAKSGNEKWMTYAVVGDGECYEGAIWESVMFAAHNKLSNLVVFLDRNGLCVTDYTEKMLIEEPFADKWTSFGWHVKRVHGHDIRALCDMAQEAISDNKENKPICIICDTHKGHGIDFMEDKLFMHGVAPKGEWAEKALHQVRRG